MSVYYFNNKMNDTDHAFGAIGLLKNKNNKRWLRVFEPVTYYMHGREEFVLPLLASGKCVITYPPLHVRK